MMAATKTLEERKQDFLNRLSNLYPDYTLISDYVDGDTFITLKHKDGYEWKTKPRYLNGKRQCPEVARQNKNVNTKKITHEEFCKRFYTKFSKDEYEIVGTYETMDKPIEIKHLVCGKSFFPIAKNILCVSKYGCTHCYSKTAKTADTVNSELIEKGLNDYICLETFTKNGHSYGKFRHNCELCENYEFTMRISDMMSKHAQRCPKCAVLENESKACKEITDFLEKNNILFSKEKTFDTCVYINNLRFDFYIENTKILIEYDGIQHFKATGFITEERLELNKKRDQIKNQWCLDNGYKLIRIKYTEDHIKRLSEELKKLYIL